MKILHCIPTLGGGGAERQLAYLCEVMANKGDEVHVAYLKPGPNYQRLKDSRAILHQIYGRSSYSPFNFLRLIKIVRQVKPDLIQTWITQMDILGGLAAILTGIPFIINERSSSEAYPPGLKNFVRSIIGKKAELVISNSKGGKEYWKQRKPAENLKVVRNGVPVEEIQRIKPVSLEAEWNVGQFSEIILFAGRFSYEKNILILAEAIGKVLEERKNCVAILMGEGPLEKVLRKTVNRLTVWERIKILGYSENLWGWLKRGRVFVSVPKFEGTPNTVLEAIACSCPVVLSDIPAHREFMNSDTAYFVPLESSRGIAGGILRALTNAKEAQEKARLAYENISKFSIENFARDYTEACRQVLEKTNKAALGAS